MMKKMIFIFPLFLAGILFVLSTQLRYFVL